MARKKSKQIEFPFYLYLKIFIDVERKQIYKTFTPLTRKFLKFNAPDNANSFLRKPQFEALEMYVFLKEFCENKPLHTVFKDWSERNDKFENRSDVGIDERSKQMALFSPIEGQNVDETEMFRQVFEQIEEFKQVYPNYIFALTMGLGKTILMATSIFYEFLLANKFPKDEKYCHNALVFAPDKTVLQSLREIESFDKSKVVPPEYVNWLDANLKFHYLDNTGDALNAIDRSKFNIIVSNTQKIILKKQSKEKTPSQKLFEDTGKIYQAKSLNEDYLDLYGFDIDTDKDLITNQRFAKLTRMKQLGIYVDEAHHVFGASLEKDLRVKTKTSLRLTINELAANLKEAGTSVVGCYNYTGTPYVKNRLLPEVVYSYGLRDAIDNQYLKQVNVKGFDNIQEQTLAFVREVIEEFWKTHKGKRYENLLPKLAFFASNLNELQTDLRPAIEQVLSELNIPITKILVNVGDPKLTTNDDIREFNDLDKPKSDKQFILLVGKGKEGWNCRSLFAVALHRKPKSRVFVLQATMRCLRQIGEIQHRGKVYLSQENVDILKKELEENMRLSLDDLNNAGDDNEAIEIRIRKPIKIKLRRMKRLHQLIEKEVKDCIYFGLDTYDTSRYEITVSEQNIKNLDKSGVKQNITEIKEKREFSELTLVAEVARYLNLSPIRIKDILESSHEGLPKLIESINEYNELLYDLIVPKLFDELYTLESYEKPEEVELDLVKQPKGKDFYQVKVKNGLLASVENAKYKEFEDKSFNLDNYCFDSNPENDLFWRLLNSKKVKKVWFTGMLTHGQTDFAINYIDPESHSLRSYYPDFLVQMLDDSYTIIEVKADFMVDNAVIKAKADYAHQIATSSDMRYKMIKGTEVNKFEL